MPISETHNGEPIVPDGYTGLALSVIACGEHGAHIDVDMYLLTEVWQIMQLLKRAHPGAPLPIDQFSPEEARRHAADLLIAADKADELIAAAFN